MKNALALKVAGIVFLAVAIMHLLRLLLKVQVTVAGRVVPQWTSLIGFLAALTLSVWIFKSAD